MSGEELREFFNRNFVGPEETPLTAYFVLTVQMVETGETFTLPALKATAATSLYDMFASVNDYLKSNGAIQMNAQPGAAPGPEEKVLNVTEITHNRKMYFVELRESGQIIIQDEHRHVIDAGSAYTGVMKKYQALQEQPKKE